MLQRLLSQLNNLFEVTLDNKITIFSLVTRSPSVVFSSVFPLVITVTISSLPIFSAPTHQKLLSFHYFLSLLM